MFCHGRVRYLTVSSCLVLVLGVLPACRDTDETDGETPEGDATTQMDGAGEDETGTGTDSSSGGGDDTGGAELAAAKLENSVDPQSLEPGEGKVVFSGDLEGTYTCEATYGSSSTTNEGDEEWYELEFSCTIPERKDQKYDWVKIELTRNPEKDSFPPGRYTSAGEDADWNYAYASLDSRFAAAGSVADSTVSEVLESNRAETADETTYTLLTLKATFRSDDESIDLVGAMYATQ